jgi:hypothetical protein
MEDRASKQQFLRNEIIDKGYNPDDFISFLDTKKLGEFDIDNFTFDELKNVNNLFVFSMSMNSSFSIILVPSLIRLI